MLRESVDFAIESMSHRKTRAFLTMLGIVIGIAAIVTLVSLGDGLENAITEEFSKMGSDIIRVVPKGLRGPPTGSQGLTVDDASVVKKVRGVEYASPMFGSNAKVEFGREENFEQVFCYEGSKVDEIFEDLGREMLDGRRFGAGERGSIFIEEKLAKDGFGSEVMVKSSIYIEDRKFRVVGIEKNMGAPGRGMITMEMEDCRELFEEEDAVSLIIVKVMSGFDTGFVAGVIEDKLERARDDENFEVYTPEQLLGQLTSILGVVSAILSAIAAISLVVGGMGIMNSMYTNVLERTRDIGVMKAVGAKNRQILSIFLVESGIYGFVGGVVGVVVGVGLSKLAEVIAVYGFGFGLLKIKIDLMLVLGVLVFSFFTGCLSGVFPSLRAAKLKPVDALRYE